MLSAVTVSWKIWLGELTQKPHHSVPRRAAVNLWNDSYVLLSYLHLSVQLGRGFCYEARLPSPVAQEALEAGAEAAKGAWI